MIDNSKEYIIYAAIKRKKPKQCHRCYYQQLSDIFEIEKGFYTSKGRFVDRTEAAKIAYECGQTSELKDILYSEDLY